MPTVDLIDVKGKKSGDVDLPGSMFDVQTNVPLIPLQIARDDSDASEAVVRGSADEAENEESQSDHMEPVPATLADDEPVVGEDKDESVVGALGLTMFNVPSPGLWGGLTNKALRVCDTPSTSLLPPQTFQGLPEGRADGQRVGPESN